MEIKYMKCTNKEFLRTCSDEELPKVLKEMYLYINNKMRNDIGSYNKLMNSNDYFR
jgi:hypothetical protein